MSRQVDPAQRHFIDLGLSQVRLLRDLVQHLTDVVRLQEGKFHLQVQEADLAQVVAESVELLQTQAEDQEIRLQRPVGPVLLNCDPQRLQQVAVNLLTNALRYGRSPKGVDVRLAREDHVVVLEVQDYGSGIPAREQPNIFTRFYQAPGVRINGLGLGLYIVKEIVETHKGTIEVHSQEGQGALFRVRLPAT